MNKKLIAWVVGGLLTATVVAFGYNSAIGSAAEKINEQKTGQAAMMQMGAQDMAKTMSSEEMQKQCQEIMNNPEMQKLMQTMMTSPEMQKMMQQGAGMMPANDSQQSFGSNTNTASVDPADHAAHHPAAPK
ncbi:hypothetical protein TcarDRAFT_1371 [Thermosinus carboxydivorans Nor1]|uniref:Uncharacterized protein n=1 Tax=Thermosinus carboxydivorans Nor1 TaxID=401526 RepID=A1HRM9_9FIRM|nr:hypothetical protein [Thermosinus carboxydivorans]EAX47353.1 hypothetical protein TcarDRAFT_1371 [Thermosinus carboxydivorans Nor1]